MRLSFRKNAAIKGVPRQNDVITYDLVLASPILLHLHIGLPLIVDMTLLNSQHTLNVGDT